MRPERPPSRATRPLPPLIAPVRRSRRATAAPAASLAFEVAEEIVMFGWLKKVFSSEEMADVAIPASASSSPEGAVQETADFAGLNFLSAIETHVKWKMRLQDYIEGRSEEKLQEDMICRDDQCVLGRWIHGPGGSMYGTHPLFAELRDTHAEFHRNAAFVVILTKDQRQTEARRELNQGEYARTSINIKRLLARLYVELRSAPKLQLARARA
jgi:hypothetical protein